MPLQEAREVDEAIEQAVGVEGGVAKEGEPRDEGAERGDESRAVRQVRPEHLGAQVHARPALFREVGQDGEAGHAGW